MIGMIVKLTIEEGRGSEFERAFAPQARAVRSQEPGNHLYELFRSRARPDAYVLVEIYDDEAALEAHRKAPHMIAQLETGRSLLAGEPEIEAFDVVPHGTP